MIDMASTTTRPAPRKLTISPAARRRRLGGRSWPWTALSTVIFLGAWELIGQLGHILAFPPLSEVAPALVHDLLHDTLIAALLGTLSIAAIGFVIGAVVGIAAGVCIGISDRVRWALDPLMTMGLAAPIVMFVPVLSIYFGIDVRAKIFLVFMLVVFVVAANTTAGIREVPESLVEMARAFSLTRREIYLKVVTPSITPHLLTGLRLGVGRAIQGAVLADLLLRANHLGEYLINAGSFFQMDKLLAGIALITVVALLLMAAMDKLQRRIVHWR
jgi:ABC-type nitrate/sulfonate/bicarbonate transport system permease component